MKKSTQIFEERAEYKRGYRRGYQAAMKNKEWGKHLPPMPPEPLVRAMYEAARELRNRADDICSVLMEDDEFTLKLAPAIDKVDAASRALTDWLAGKETTP